MQGHFRDRVLVVEDELMVRLDLSEAIELLGLDVVHVPSADAALDVLQDDHSFGWVFTDIIMPGRIDGIQLTKKIRQFWPSISVVVSSGYIATDSRCDSLGVPMLHKPYKLEELRQVLGHNC